MTKRFAPLGVRAARLAGVFAFCAAALAFSAGTSEAQVVAAGSRRPIAVKIGTYLPAGSEARRASASAIFSIEAEYTIQDLLDKNSYTPLSIGYIGGEDLSIIPITIGQIFKDANNPTSNDYYYGFGLGIYATDVDTADTSGRRKGLFGGYGVVGLDLQGGKYLVEAKYHWISRYDNKEVSGLQIMAGARF